MKPEEELLDAVKQGDVNRARECVEAGSDVNVHGTEQEWTPLNYAAGQGNLEIVKLLVGAGANVLKTGRDNRTPYEIALAAGHAEVARYLAEAEESAGGDRTSESRQYCKAYYLRDIRRFAGWSESRINWVEAGDDDGEKGPQQSLSDNDIVFIHQDFTVTQSMFQNENVIMNDVTPEWRKYCSEALKFKVPTDFDLMPPKPLETVSQNS